MDVCSTKMASQATLKAQTSISLCFTWPGRSSIAEQHSDILHCDALPEVKWQMHLHLKSNGMFNLQLEILEDCLFNAMLINGQLSIKDIPNSLQLYYCNSTVPFSAKLCDKVRTLQVDNWLNSHLLQKHSGLTFTVQCNLTVSLVADSLGLLPWQRLSQFALDTFLSDVTIVVDEQTFAAHKLVLAANSPVLRAMFCVDMHESRCNTVQIDDCSAETFEAFLRYLYSDTVDDSVLSRAEMAADLLVLANKYQVDRLKSRCSMWLRSNLSVENVLSVASLSDLHCQSDLLEVCVRCIAMSVPELTKSNDWEQFVQSHPKLITRVLSVMHNVASWSSTTWKE